MVILLWFIDFIVIFDNLENSENILIKIWNLKATLKLLKIANFIVINSVFFLLSNYPVKNPTWAG